MCVLCARAVSLALKQLKHRSLRRIIHIIRRHVCIIPSTSHVLVLVIIKFRTYGRMEEYEYRTRIFVLYFSPRWLCSYVYVASLSLQQQQGECCKFSCSSYTIYATSSSTSILYQRRLAPSPVLSQHRAYHLPGTRTSYVLLSL